VFGGESRTTFKQETQTARPPLFPSAAAVVLTAAPFSGVSHSIPLVGDPPAYQRTVFGSKEENSSKRSVFGGGRLGASPNVNIFGGGGTVFGGKQSSDSDIEPSRQIVLSSPSKPQDTPDSSSAFTSLAGKAGQSGPSGSGQTSSVFGGKQEGRSAGASSSASVFGGKTSGGGLKLPFTSTAGGYPFSSKIFVR
jgi:hypothetical protein